MCHMTRPFLCKELTAVITITTHAQLITVLLEENVQLEEK